MRARWEGVHAALVRSVSTLQADRQFRDARRAEAILGRFESAAGLIEHLTGKGGNLDEKDAIYAALVRTVQTRAPWAEVAKALLWCGLWPALDGIYRHRLRHFKQEPEELVEAIAVAFTTLIGRMDLARVRRVAATLAWSSDREVMSELQHEWAERSHRDARRGEDAPEPATPPLRDSDLGLPVGLSFDGELGALRARLLPIGGADTDLLLAVLVLDENQREAADRLGLTHEAARKRFQRALDRVRGHLADALSQLATGTRVSGGARARKPGGAQR
ncbi:MAG: sigma-70 family RNA polymerase sigma factor [Polyangiaceae bacterium]